MTLRMLLAPVMFLPAACGQVPVSKAEAQCREAPREVVSPRGTVGIGIGSGGRVSGGLGVSLSGDLRGGRRTGETYAACVIRKSGEPPYLIPEGTG